MQRARALDAVELALQPCDALADQPAVDFELALAGAAQKAEAAALAFEMGPRPHQPRALVGERRQLDLQPAFMGARALAEDFEDQPGAVDDLGLPASLEIALLHRRQCAVDHDEPDRVVFDATRGDCRRCRCRTTWRAAARTRRAISARTTSRRIARASPTASSSRASSRSARSFAVTPAGRRFWRRMQDQRAAGRRAVRERQCVPFPAQSSSFSLPGSNSWIGCAGITVEIACL